MVELTSLDVHYLARELGELEDAYVDKVYQPGPDEYLLKLRRPRHGLVHLVLHPGSFAASTSASVETPEQPSSVAMSLRKHLSGARLRRVEQHEFDRVLTLQFDVRGEPIELHVELFGKGNLILADAQQRILLAHRSETFAHRTVKRGEPLKFPPPRANPKTMTPQEFDELTDRSSKDLVRFLAMDAGLGGDLAEELVHRTGLEKSRPAKALVASDRQRVWDELRKLLAAPAQPGLARGPDSWRPLGVPFQGPRFQAQTFEPTATLSEAILRAAAEQTPALPPPGDAERRRLERQLDHQRRSIEELEAEAHAWERRGHHVYEHYATVQPILDSIRAAWSTLDSKELAKRLKASRPDDAWTRTVVRYDAEHQRFQVRVAGEEIPFDPRDSMEQTAGRLYEEGKRARAKLEGARAAVQATTRLMEDLASHAPARSPATRSAPKRRFWFDSFRWFYTSDELLVVAGRDAAGNEKLVKRHLKAGDRFVHADIHGAPSAIVKAEGAPPSEQSLAQAAQFAATYSRAFAQFLQADAYWVTPEQVSKTPESGEFVPKGAFIVRGLRHYYHKINLEAAIGLVRLSKEGKPTSEDPAYPRLVGGPPDAIARFAPRYVVVQRGDLKATDAARQLAPHFGVTLEEVQAVLPPGPVRIGPPREGRT